MKRKDRAGIAIAGLAWYAGWVYIAEHFVLPTPVAGFADHLAAFTLIGGGLAIVSAMAIVGLVALGCWVVWG